MVKSSPEVQEEPSVTASSSKVYKPQEYNQKRLKVIEDRKSEGHTFKKASEMWSESDERCAILATLSVAKLH